MKTDVFWTALAHLNEYHQAPGKVAAIILRLSRDPFFSPLHCHISTVSGSNVRLTAHAKHNKHRENEEGAMNPSLCEAGGSRGPTGGVLVPTFYTR